MGLDYTPDYMPAIPSDDDCCCDDEPLRTCAKCSSGEVTVRYVPMLTSIDGAGTEIDVEVEHLDCECECSYQWSTPCDDAEDEGASCIKSSDWPGHPPCKCSDCKEAEDGD